jgi:predicted acetyltransferase
MMTVGYTAAERMACMAAMGKTEYRKVTPEEKLHIARQQSISFYPHMRSAPDEEEIRARIAGGEYISDNTYGAVDSNGRVLAGMEALPFLMWYDGQKVPMVGIGGVVSLPENRRQGHIKNIFMKIFKDAYDKGDVFSHLYPFSYSFYRRFGYEHCGAAIRYTLPLAPARKLKNDGTAHEFIRGDAAREALINVYESYASRHNLSIFRSEKTWNDVFDVSLFSLDRLYYWRNAEQQVAAWVKYKRENETIMISDIAWSDHAGMLGILQFIGMYEGAAKKLSFRSSPECAAGLYWDELYDIETEPFWQGMNRVINAQRALEMMQKPEEPGAFAVKITDEFAPWNSGVYTVQYGGGDSVVTKSISGADPDMETAETAFTQMILGVYDLQQLVRCGAVRVNSRENMLYKVFVKKPLLITDMF